ncbi:hypothetical protein L1987_63997 [Smallanthus sonchifolius]|uniref:Uncharacterized protein n=1 Tax=Smallanthus sonchifolius TaxID=185202 RepID=A0ACB9CET2_9ASTR|nr:hypothetical protein L1987_63997 [Smallanthus sonchifolius]
MVPRSSPLRSLVRWRGGWGLVVDGVVYGSFFCWFKIKFKIFCIGKHEDLIKHAKGNGRYRRISDDEVAFEVLRLLDAKTSHIQMDRRNRKSSSTQKRSLKARIKALVSEDQDFVPSPRLHRTYSIHHLESNEWVHPIVFYPENGTESPVSSETHSNVIGPEINDSQDILDMFEVDKDVFVNTLKDRSQASVITSKLTKSGSFPTAYRSLMPMKLKDKVNETYTISKSGKILNDDVIRLRRISSLNESADRYTRLFDFSVGKEATLRSSRSLKLTSGSESILSAQQPTSFRRNIPIQESHDAYFLRSSSQNDKYAELNSLNEVIDNSDKFSENEDSPEANSLAFGKDSHGLKIEEDNNQISQEISQQSPVLVPEYFPPYEKLQISEGLYLLKENHKKEIKTINSKKHMDLSIKDDDFTYVKKILERSGFLKNGFQRTWYASYQPLDPFMFQELESQYFHDPDRFAEEVNILSHHLLLFDLVDEVLLTMYERSSTYYPKKLSSFHIWPAPTGSRAVDEVWNCISQWINLKHDLNESLNDIVARDLGSYDGWMSLQSDSECVGLDLEDLILDDVLEEFLFELF